ncbi:hypothetical protein HVTV-2_gp142 [Haloarcula virus HVTV-2]|uniref:Uncharacterized protein n=1 Tax=Haloarcula vallismortis tailed virus 1 TaxID=1262528 RepID=L7TKK0_9CAUD|nr:hypothetical protein HVTV1_141 [Haloarcula vallismortis tailed virus 1]AGC34510.1 hypothetical protein HVTV1_141 [Haloarcula vallismortis tailed virus 1]UBF22949.1 hypothetical protein HVTV-2_gp142 [Haloarcula virus HVTV-2]
MTSESDTMVRLPILRDLTYREWHAFVNGYYKGVVEGSRKNEYEKEKHYWRAGYLLGSGTRYVALLILILVVQ